MNWRLKLIVDKKQDDLAWFVARHLPKKVRYWSVVDVAVTVEKMSDPSNVTAIQMLKELEK